MALCCGVLQSSGTDRVGSPYLVLLACVRQLASPENLPLKGGRMQLQLCGYHSTVTHSLQGFGKGRMTPRIQLCLCLTGALSLPPDTCTALVTDLECFQPQLERRVLQGTATQEKGRERLGSCSPHPKPDSPPSLPLGPRPFLLAHCRPSCYCRNDRCVCH